MNRLVRKLSFLWLGNISKWIYYGGEKSIGDVAKENNLSLGIMVTFILGGLMYFYFF
ncbi:MAG: hypothetical protein ACI87N_002769 [Flavobacteriales bacterium]|jgi:hypothetical protein